jgi:hypothetical protein
MIYVLIQINGPDHGFRVEDAFYSGSIDEIAERAFEEEDDDPIVEYGHTIGLSFDLEDAFRSSLEDQVNNENGYVDDVLGDDRIAKAQELINEVIRSMPRAYESSGDVVPKDIVEAAMTRARDAFASHEKSDP